MPKTSLATWQPAAPPLQLESLFGGGGVLNILFIHF